MAKDKYDEVIENTGRMEFWRGTGEITGLVTDSSGAAVSGANVYVTNKATGATRKMTTNSVILQRPADL